MAVHELFICLCVCVCALYICMNMITVHYICTIYDIIKPRLLYN